MFYALQIAAAVLVCYVVSASRISNGPNVVLLLADDYGWGDPSPPLGVGRGLTPELNAMARAKGAVHFPRGYIGGSVCSPSRAALLSGRSSVRDCVISVETFALPLQLQGQTLADIAHRAGMRTAIFGKWHLGSLSNSTTIGCYNATKTNGTCLSGYIAQAGSGVCCDNRDGPLPMRTPLDFGFDDVMVTPQVAPSATSNCGCLETVSGAGVGCELGHYEGAGHQPAWAPGLECMQTWTTTEAKGWAPFSALTAVDDAAQLVDRFEEFLSTSVAADAPFLAAIWFHQTHIPYVAPPAFRAMYPNATPNEADYFGAATAMDAQVGRVRKLLAAAGVSNTTLLVFASDNGPEVSPAGGQFTSSFPNPGVTGGLSGRKRALLEGGIRTTFVVEAPWLVARANGGSGGPLRLDDYAASHTDLVPTLLDLLGSGDIRRNTSWPLDGLSLVPALTGSVTTDRAGALGWLCAWQLTTDNAAAECPSGPAVQPPSCPANFTAPDSLPQVAWMEGPLKLIACRNSQAAWRWRLFNITADPTETLDLFADRITEADAIFQRLHTWLVSVNSSRTVESECASQHHAT